MSGVSQEHYSVLVLKDFPGAAPDFQERSNAYDLGRATFVEGRALSDGAAPRPAKRAPPALASRRRRVVILRLACDGHRPPPAEPQRPFGRGSTPPA